MRCKAESRLRVVSSEAVLEVRSARVGAESRLASLARSLHSLSPDCAHVPFACQPLYTHLL